MVTLTQLVLENAPAEEIEPSPRLLTPLVAHYVAQLDITEDIPAKMRIVAESGLCEGETIHNMPVGKADQVYAALLVADQYGQRFLQEWE